MANFKIKDFQKIDDRLFVHSIFPTISGEIGVIDQGTACSFLRLGGCDLRCSWCDAPTALTTENGKWMSFDEIEEALPIKDRLVITGGEPLLQMTALREFITNWENVATEERREEYRLVQIETGGHIVPYFKENAYPDCLIVDYKLPSSGMHKSVLPIETIARKFMEHCTTAYVKFVYDGQEELKQALELVKAFTIEADKDLLSESPHFAFSPMLPRDGVSYSNTNALKENVETIIKYAQDLPEVGLIFNFQLHKLVGIAPTEEIGYQFSETHPANMKITL